MTNEKIEKWRKEIEDCTEKIKELKKKISAEEHRLELENNELIAQVVRDALGEISSDNLETFKEQIQLLVGLEEKPDEGQKDNIQGYE